MSTAIYRSPSGVDFTFVVHSPRLSWPKQAGLYWFCWFDARTSKFVPVYIGQCEDFNARLCGHERWQEAVAAGATHVLLCPVPLQDDRDRFEAVLIGELQPRLNTLLRRGLRRYGT